MSTTIYQGTDVTITCTFYDASGNLIDPTVITCSLRAPSGAVTVYSYADSQITRESEGVYAVTVPTNNAPGAWIGQWEGQGTVQITYGFAFTVTSTPFRT